MRVCLVGKKCFAENDTYFGYESLQLWWIDMNHVDGFGMGLHGFWFCCRRVHLPERRRMALRPIRRRDLPPAPVLWFPHPWPAPTHLPPPPLRPHPGLARKYKFYTPNCNVAFAIAIFQYTCLYVYIWGIYMSLLQTPSVCCHVNIESTAPILSCRSEG